MNSKVRVRIAPSPTGFVHIGLARTALFNYFFAKKNKGDFVLRIEDTDKERSKKEFEEDIINNLKWLGLNWDEFYRQSDRVDIYKKYIEQLLKSGKAFWCLHTEEELEQESERQYTAKEAPRHICEHKRKNLKPESGQSGVIRLAVDSNADNAIIFNDIVRGKIKFDSKLLGDFSIAKSPEEPLYHMSVVVDDYEMKISHVIRGEEHLANTPKHILIQEALGFDTPAYVHLPLILNKDRSKLSKRHGAVSVGEFRGQGYLPEAIINYLGLLGFTPKGDREVLSFAELTGEFELERIHKAGAIFDYQKLDWLNGEYIKKMNPQNFAERLFDFMEGQGIESGRKSVENIVSLVQTRLRKLSDIKDFDYLFKEPEFDKNLLKWKGEDIGKSFDALREVLVIVEKSGVDDMSRLRDMLNGLSENIGGKGLVFWPFRVAITGKESSPDPVEVAKVIGKEKTIARVKKALNFEK
ncbi:MAG: glutamyl-tRNA synthetase [Parcubacteria group bacterium Licking1014_17]|nr:MAG: glutamyl-tRNA synthetase [Parcubacteria group bacterium Licking1014_17]